MKPEQLVALLRYRMEQAHESLHEAEILLEASAFRGTTNRAYYAMFYGLLALLATKQLGTSKHSGAISLFDREFVKTGLFPREMSRHLHLAFDRRQKYDYGEMVVITEEKATQGLADSRAFLVAIESYLTDAGHLGSVGGEAGMTSSLSHCLPSQDFKSSEDPRGQGSTA